MFEYKQVIAVAHEHLGLSPAEAWKLTPDEYVLLLNNKQKKGAPRMTREAAQAMYDQFPDEPA